MTSIDQFFLDYKHRFTIFADSYVHNSQLAEDIVTDAFMAYWVKYRNNPPKDMNVPAYILTIVKNKCLNELEHRRVMNEYADAVMSDSRWELEIQINSLKECNPEKIFSKEMEELVRKSLNRLSPKTRKIFTMSRVDQMTYREIAAELDINIKTVEYHMGLALKHLHADLAGYFAIIIFFL